MSSRHFTISWIYEEFHVCRISRGEVAAHWISPEPVPDLAAFSAALIKASASLGMNRGGDIAIAYESDDHAHVFLDLPPMPRRDLERYLERRVEQEKGFDEPAVWSYRDVEHDREGAGVLLHVMPKRVLDAVLRICQENHVVPMRMVPLTDIMVHNLPETGVGSEEVILIVALFDSRVECVVATAKGEALFVRELKYHWRDEQLERLRVDIERTSLYIKQRQKTITRALVMGPEAATAIEAFAGHVPFPIDAPTPSTDPLFWSKEVHKLPNNTTSNFIPRIVQRAIHAKRALRSASWFAYAAVATAIVVTAWIEYLIWEQVSVDPELYSRLEVLRESRDELHERTAVFELLEQRLDRLTPKHAPLPAWFLSRLDEFIPEDAILSVARLGRDAGTWDFELEGATTPTLAASANTVARIESALEQGPWRAEVSESWRGEWIELLRNGRAAETGRMGFRLSGVLGE